ncbi:MAG: TspO/MBR family protein, partial [Pseudomonadota bacterium]
MTDTPTAIDPIADQIRAPRPKAGSRSWLILAGLIVACLGVGILASFATSESVVTWYPTLEKPFFNPPNWLFGPVWSVLYVAMAVAAWLVWRSPHEGPDKPAALRLFAVQLVANAAWSFAFFGAQSPALGMVVVIALLTLVGLTGLRFLRILPLAGVLFVPYFA